METRDGDYRKRKTALGKTCNEKSKFTFKNSDGSESDGEKTRGKTENEMGRHS